MKKFCLATLLISGILTVWAAPTRGFERKFETVSSSEMKISFVPGDYNIVNVTEGGVTYSKLIFEGGVRVEKKGFADIPVLSATVQLGDEYDVEITSADGDYTDIKLDHPMLPSRGTIYRNQNPDEIPYEIDPKSVIDEWYPGAEAYNSEPFAFRDTRGVSVYVHPFQYNAETRTLRIYNNMTVILKEDISKTTNPLKIKPSGVDASMVDIYRSLYINYDEMRFTNQIGQFGEMLVLYTSRDATAIQPYIDWKREKGFTVQTTQLATGTNAKTTIQNAYNSNPNLLYVQLVGDFEDIGSDTQTFGTVTNAPMDPMMGCVVGTDYYPELMIGRFSANSAAEVSVQVNKTIDYEKNPDLGASWYKNALGMARNEGAGSGDDGEGDDLHMERIREYRLLPYNYSTVYQEYDGNSSYVASNTTASIISGRINDGISLLNYCNHGDETYWSVANYGQTHVNALTNGSKLPFIWSVACVVGRFNRTGGDCFAETWVKKDGGGAVAFFGATINQPWQPPMRGQDYMNDILVGGYDYSSNPGNGISTTSSDKRTTFGSISMNGCVLMLSEISDSSSSDTMRTWTIFGDASLQVRTDTPKVISFDDTVIPGSYSTTVTTGGQPVEGALVSLYRNGTTVSGFTNLSGAVTLNHSFGAGEQVTLTVTGYNLETSQSLQMVVGDIGGNFALSTGSLSYGNVSVGYNSNQTFQISNSHATEYLTGEITTITGYTVSLSSKDGVESKDIKNSLSYSVAPGTSKTFNLTFEPSAAVSYNGNITITSSDDSNPTNYLAVTGTGIVPDISLPLSLSATTAPGSSKMADFDVENLGQGILDYSISTNYTSGKDLKGSGGPDAYGYKWKDSDEVGGPVYSWIDITSLGTKLGITGIDQTIQNIPVGFDFNFYGNTYNTVNICTNGFISFTSTVTTYTNTAIPNSAEPNNMIAPFWDDFDARTSSGSDGIYYYHDSANGRFIVTYNDIVRWNTAPLNTFQLILYPSGKIVYQYNTLNGLLTSCTVGIENQDGTTATQVVFDSSYLKNNFAVQFQATPEWLTLSKTSGSVSGLSSDTITATYDATDLEEGVYTADLTVTSNDPDTPGVVIPVTFTVAYGETGGTFSINTSSLNYGSVPVGQNSVQQFSITNSHSEETIAGSITTIAGYTVSLASKESKNVLNYMVGPNSSKIFDLSFAPLLEQEYNGNISITSSDPNFPQVYISVTGTGTEPEVFVVNTFPWEESFDGSIFVPEHWEMESNSSNTWTSATSVLVGTTTYYPAHGTRLAYVQWHGTDSQNEWLITPLLNFSSITNPELYFYFMGSYYWSVTYPNCTLKVMRRVSGGSWSEIWRMTDHTSFNADYVNYTWLEASVPISVHAKGYVELAFVYEGTDGANFAIDGVMINGEAVVTPGTPSNLVTSISGSNLVIDWDDSPNADSYDVYSSDDPYGSFSFESNVGSSQYSVEYTEAKKFYYVVAKNSAKRNIRPERPVLNISAPVGTTNTDR